MMKKYLWLFIAFLLSATTIVNAQQIGRWEKLGERSVDFKTDKDVIRAAGKGTFTRLKFRVKGNDVEFKKVIVKFANGSSQELKIRQFIPAGGETREIDLRGNKRIIKEIVFYYKTTKNNNNNHGRPGSGDRYNDRGSNNRHNCNGNGNNKRKATVSVWGRH